MFDRPFGAQPTRSRAILIGAVFARYVHFLLKFVLYIYSLFVFISYIIWFLFRVLKKTKLAEYWGRLGLPSTRDELLLYNGPTVVVTNGVFLAIGGMGSGNSLRSILLRLVCLFLFIVLQ